MDEYVKKAQLLESHFGIYGVGNFDLTTQELAKLLKLVVEEDAKGIQQLYEQLEQLRMGETS